MFLTWFNIKQPFQIFSFFLRVVPRVPFNRSFIFPQLDTPPTPWAPVIMQPPVSRLHFTTPGGFPGRRHRRRRHHSVHPRARHAHLHCIMWERLTSPSPPNVTRRIDLPPPQYSARNPTVVFLYLLNWTGFTAGSANKLMNGTCGTQRRGIKGVSPVFVLKWTKRD